MVSLNDRQALAASAVADSQLKKLQLFLDGEHSTDVGGAGDGLHERLLAAIIGNDPAQYNRAAGELSQRKIKPESDWCHDDYLLFLLLLGKEKFGSKLSFLAQVIDCRRKNSNPVPRKINEVFAALERQEFGIDGEFGFLKIPFLHLVGKLRIGPVEAKKAIQAMSVPALLDQLSPFLKLLTTKAYDLVLTERQPIALETGAQLIEGIEIHGKDLSLRNWWQILTALPGRFIWGTIVAILGLGLIPILFGVGKGLVDVQIQKENRIRPEPISIESIREPGSEVSPELSILIDKIRKPTSPGGKSLIIIVATQPFATATPAFVVESSHPNIPIRNAFAFVQNSDQDPRIFTIIPVQRDAGRFRALIPQLDASSRVVFALEMEIGGGEDAAAIGKAIVLRSLP